MTKLNDCFDHIYCLTLDRRPERWRKVKQKFKELNIEVERFSAIDGNTLPEGKIKKYPILNKYAIGCMLSHYKIIENAKKNKYKNILIFEDDVIFHKNFVEEFSKQIKKIKNWKLLHLGATQTHWDNIEFEDGFYYSLTSLGTFAIGVNESIYEEILALTNINAAIDTKYINIQHKHYKECYTFYPNLVIADVSESDIRGHRDETDFRKMAKWDSSLYNTNVEQPKEASKVHIKKEDSLKCPHCGKELPFINKEDKFQCIITRNLSMTSAFIPVQKAMLEKFENVDEYRNILLLLGYNVGCDIDEYRRIYPGKKIIIYQLEQLFDNKSQWYNINSSNKEVVRRTKHIKETLQKCDEIWDYDIDNIEFLKSEGFDKIKHVPLPYSKKLKRINRNKNPEYDIIFYGSINERRIKFLEYLKDDYKLLILAPSRDVERYKDSKIGKYMIGDIYGDDLFEYIFNSKIVLNLHYYDSKIQEQVRIFELLINDKTVVSEKSRINYYGNMIHEFETPEEMVEIINSLLEWRNCSISNEFKKKPSENFSTKQQPFKRFKVGAAYNTFYGIELLEKSIESIRPTVDYVVIVHQRKSFSGNMEDPNNDKLFKKMLDDKLIDDIIYYDQINKNIQTCVLEKRNIGLEYCKKNKCDFIIPMDADERYNKTELLEELNYMYDNDIKTLYSPIHSYFYDEYHYFADTYYVPSAFRIDNRVFEISQSSVLVDPVRKMTEKKYRISKMPMHHYTYLKNSFKNKIGKSVSSYNPEINKNFEKIHQYLQNWKEGMNGLVFTNSPTGGVVLTEMPLKEI